MDAMSCRCAAFGAAALTILVTGFFPGARALEGSASAQPPEALLADIVYDPFVEAEKQETGGSLLVHYAKPLVDDSGVYMESKSGSYVSCQPPGSGLPAPCGPAGRASQTWNVRKLVWRGTALVEAWNFASDWKPEPAGGAIGDWEPVFHPAIAGDFVYVPGAGGTVFKLARSDGRLIARINPFGTSVDAATFVAGGLAADGAGSVFYNVVRLDLASPWIRQRAGRLAGQGLAGRLRSAGRILGSRAGRAGRLGAVPAELHEQPAVASLGQRRAAQRIVRIAASGNQRDSRDRLRRDRVHGQPRALQWTLQLLARGQSGPHAAVEREPAGNPFRRLRRPPSPQRNAGRLPRRREGRSGSRDQRHSRRTRLGPLLVLAARASRRLDPLRRLHELQLLARTSLPVLERRARSRDVRFRLGHHAGGLPARRDLFDPRQGQPLRARLLLRGPRNSARRRRDATT